MAYQPELPTIRRRLLGSQLRRLREDAGLSLDDATQILECDKSKISRIETGNRGITVGELKTLLTEYGVTDPKHREALLTIARESRKRGWWNDYAGVLHDPYRDYMSLEAMASEFKTYEPQLIPGLLQTDAYVRATVEAAKFEYSEEQIAAALEVRAARRAALEADQPLRVWAILDEAMLRRQLVHPDAAREQLQYLYEISKLRHVTIQVLPFSAGVPAWLGQPFIILGFPEPADLDVVYLENLTSGLYLEERREVERYSLMFDHLRTAACSREDSRALLARTAKELE